MNYTETINQTLFANTGKYWVSHAQWITDHRDLVNLFFAFADKERLAGRKVGARFILEFLRWKSACKELDCEFKINNDNMTLLAHLYNDSKGRSGYFRTKEVTNLKEPPQYKHLTLIAGGVA